MKNSDSIDKVFKIRCGAVFLSKTFFGGDVLKGARCINKRSLMSINRIMNQATLE